MTPWTVGRQAPLSMGFPGQEYWNGLPCSPPGDLSDPGIEPGSPVLQEDCLRPEPLGKPWIQSSPVTNTLQGDCSSDIRQGIGLCPVRWTSAQLQMQEEEEAENT